jgi:hypothetical protein
VVLPLRLPFSLEREKQKGKSGPKLRAGEQKGRGREKNTERKGRDRRGPRDLGVVRVATSHVPIAAYDARSRQNAG